MLCTYVDDVTTCYLPTSQVEQRSLRISWESSRLVRPNREVFATADGDLPSKMTSALRSMRRRTLAESNRPISIDKSRKGTDVVTEKELTCLRSGTGLLAWVARYCRADLANKVIE